MEGVSDLLAEGGDLVEKACREVQQLPADQSTGSLPSVGCGGHVAVRGFEVRRLPRDDTQP